MENSKYTKQALLMSIVALFMSVTMLIGSTYAWFNDSVSSKNNVIKTGDLEVSLEYSLNGTDWAPVTETTAIFNESDVWEPGHTVSVALRASNTGTLALKYNLSSNIISEQAGTNSSDETFKLSDYLEVYAVTLTDTTKLTDYLANRDLTDFTKYAFDVDVVSNKPLEKNEFGYTVLCITMPQEVGNAVNYKTGTTAPSINFGITVSATQYESESDFFGTDYDSAAVIVDN